MDVYDEVDRRETDAGETFWNKIKKNLDCCFTHKMPIQARVLFQCFCIQQLLLSEFLCLALPEGDVNWKNLVFFTKQRIPWGKAFLWIDCVCVWNCNLLFDKEILPSTTGRLFPLFFFFSSGAVWLATQNHSTLVTETTVVPFLPVNPEYSSTRNQVWNLNTSKII